MTDPDALFSPQAVAARCIAACDDYLKICRSAIAELSDPTCGVAQPQPQPQTMAFLAPWQAFAHRLGMQPDGAATMPFAGSMPGLGPLREHQESGQRMVELSKRFTTCYAELLRHAGNVNRQAVQAMQAAAAADGSLLDSPQRGYDVWIECAERAYAPVAHSEAYARLLAELCNILSAFKVERGKLLEYFAKLLDLPSRAEIDGLHREVRALRDELRRVASGDEIR
jgi:class III poly(R)-hydroxyalkanoic acid synthase PhaE subunit